jgi:hypothetical protein
VDNNGEIPSKKEELQALLSTAEDVQHTRTAENAVKGRTVWLGTSASEADVGTLSARQISRVVFIAGMPNTGKTTLLASLYDAFLRGPVDPVQFAGSRTLPRLEAISFYARIESERESAATKRTNFKDEVEFVHLDLARRSGGDRFHLFLTDISGEAFEHVRDSVQYARRFSIVRYADFLCLMVDAAVLSNLEKRQGAAHDADLILDSFMQEGLISQSTSVQVVVSRTDLIPLSDEARTRAFIRSVVDSLLTRIQGVCARAGMFMIAARPSHGKPVGLQELFDSWFAEQSAERARLPQFADEKVETGAGTATRPGGRV